MRTGTLVVRCKLGAALPMVAFAMAGQAPGVACRQLERWTVGAEPTLSIGTVAGDEGEMLTNVLAAMVLSDGSIALQNSNRGLFEIRYFRADGSYVRTASHWGEGPYEFHYALGVHRIHGDSIRVLGEDGRFAVFGPTGERGREGRMEGLLDVMPVILAMQVDATHLSFLKPLGSGLPEPGIHRGRGVAALVFDLQQQQAETMTTATGRETYYEAMETGRGVRFYPTPFGPETFVAAGGGLVWVGDNATPKVSGYRPGAETPAVVIESPFEARAVSSDDRSRMRQVYAEQFSGDTQKRWARYARTMAFPDRMPWFGDLVVDRLGNLWMQEYEPYSTEGDRRWAVFSQGGEQVAEVAVPRSALPSCDRPPVRTCLPGDGFFEIGEDYFLVAQSDELDVRYVRKFPLMKATRGGG